MRQAATNPILIVSDARDASIQEAIAQLEDTGAAVEVVPDVYAAMARLAQGQRFALTLVDVRTLDRAEAEFIQLAPRYIDDLRIEVPWLEGTTQAVVQLGQPSLQTTEVASLAERLLGSNCPAAADLPEAPPQEDSTNRESNLSTDGVKGAIDEGPSLHEAVRLRMAGGDDAARAEKASVPPVRRQPPNRIPPTHPKNIDALIDTPHPADGNRGREDD